MEYSNYAFILHDMAAAKGRRVISRRNARVYRGDIRRNLCKDR